MIGGPGPLRADRLRDPSEANREDLWVAGAALLLCLASIAAIGAIMWLGT